jgi:hypothetical protein
MSADRARRDAAAGALASFLRGQTDRIALAEAFQSLPQPADPEGQPAADRDRYLDDLMILLWSVPGAEYEATSEEEWTALCRHLAFLTSNLEGRSWDDQLREDEDRPYQIWLARWHAAGLLVAAGVSYMVNWWLFVVANVASYALYFVALSRHEAPEEEQNRVQRAQRLEFYPFADRDEWLAHQQLLDGYHLPGYDPAVFTAAPRVWTWPALLILPVWVGYSLFVVLAFVCMFAFSTAFWPLYLVLMSLCSRAPEQERV